MLIGHRVGLAAAVMLPLLISCAPDILVVPLRVCVVHGADFAPTAVPLNQPAITTRAHEIVTAASRIWMDAASIGFLPYPDVLVIEDPNPSTAARQHVGDIVQDLGIGRGSSQEATDVVEACDAEWARGPSGKPPGLTLVFVRDFPSSGGGVNIDLLGFTPPPGTSQCTSPYAVDPAFVRARWSIAKTHITASQTPAQWLALVSHTTAHELGHAMMLGHGNGKDANGDGRWGEECDPIEYEQYDVHDAEGASNLMHPRSEWGTTLTALQRDLARAAAAQAITQ
ncbi:MAG: hypothetical protein ABIZ70_14025 [Gemmatimonadales bacterium]